MLTDPAENLIKNTFACLSLWVSIISGPYAENEEKYLIGNTGDKFQKYVLLYKIQIEGKYLFFHITENDPIHYFVFFAMPVC